MALPVTFSVRTLIAALSLMLGGAVCAAEPDCRPGCNPGIATADAGIASQPTTKPGDYSHEIKDPYYGNTLFEFYQDHDFTALT